MKWQKIWTRDYTIAYTECCLSCYSIFAKNNDFDYYNDILFLFDKGASVYSTEEEINSYQKKILKKYASSFKDIGNLEKEFEDFCEKFLGFVNPFVGVDLSIKTEEEIRQILKKYYGFWHEFTLYLWIFYHLSELYSNFAFESLKDIVDEDVLEYMTKPNKKSSILLLDEIISNMKKSGKIDKEKILEEYVWLPYGDLHTKPWTFDDVEKYVSRHKIAENKDVNISKIDGKHKEIIKINKELTYLRDYRDEVRRKTVYAIHFVVEELAKRKGISYDEILIYTMPEMIKGFDLDDEEKEARKSKMMFVLENNYVKIIHGKDMLDFIDKNDFNIEKKKSLRKISGTIASKGKTSGRVKIIKLDKEISKINHGDIMVAVTTHPEFVSKMRICKAIVTDEGGLTCHAAIVAREMKKPCIVGTKNATKIFKDGDLVEVDAEKGVVRKI